MGFFSSALTQIAGNIDENTYPYESLNKWTWLELSSAESTVKFCQLVRISF